MRGGHVVRPGMDGGAVRDIDDVRRYRHARRPARDLGGGFRQPGLVAVGNGHVAAFLRELDRQASAHARTGAGDGGHLVSKHLHAGLLFFLRGWLDADRVGVFGLRHPGWLPRGPALVVGRLERLRGAAELPGEARPQRGVLAVARVDVPTGAAAGAPDGVAKLLLDVAVERGLQAGARPRPGGGPGACGAGRRARSSPVTRS